MKKIESFSVAESFGWKTADENELMEINGGSGSHDTYCGCYGDNANSFSVNSNNNNNNTQVSVAVKVPVPICGNIKPANANKVLMQSAVWFRFPEPDTIYPAQD